MARLVTSRLTDAVMVHARDAHRVIAPGEVVDLDESMGDGLTLGAALGDLTGCFTDAEDVDAGTVAPSSDAAAPTDAPPRKQRRSTATKESES